MGSLKNIFLWIGFFSLLVLTPAGEALSGTEPNQTIDHLLRFVGQSNCLFIRNGKAYDSGTALEHIRRKYEYFRDQVRTPEDFIDLAATRSTRSGEPYEVECEEGKRIPCSEWLRQELVRYRESGERQSEQPSRPENR